MIAFDPADPFPLVTSESSSYAEEQAHSAQVDAWLGLRTEEIETHLKNDTALVQTTRDQGQQLWIGLSTQSMLTPYVELRRILHELAPKPGSLVVDLGAGYGRMAFVIGRHFPETRFLGYEVVAERVASGNDALARQGYRNVELRHADLAHPGFNPIEADYYFLYDYGSREAIEKTLHDLRAIAQRRPITVVGRGRASRDAIERRHPWLASMVAPVHSSHTSIYRSA